MRLIPSPPDLRNSCIVVTFSCMLAASFTIPVFAGEGDTRPAETVEVVEPAPALPDGVALDSEGNAYPEGGPAGLYNAIIDKQQKLGMTGVYDADGNLIGVSYESSNHGQQVALAHLRENLERKLKKQGLLDDAPEVPEPEQTAESTGAELPGEGIAVTGSREAGKAEETEPLPVLPVDVAADSEGNAYPAGGPAGLYNAITDKQQKLGMKGIYDADGNLESVAYEGTNPGQQTALSRLRENLERKLKKLGLFDETPEPVETVKAAETAAAGELAAAEMSVSDKSSRSTRVGIEKTQMPVKLEKTVKPERVTRPEKIQRVEKPSRPEKITRVEKPQRPEKITRVEKPQRPEKPQKPDRPGHG